MAADTIRFIVTVAIVVYKGLIPVVGRMLTSYGQSAYIPSVRQLSYLFAVRHQINECITEVGGTPINLNPGECWLWSSTEVEGQKENKAWLYSMQSSTIQEAPKDQAHKFRPVISVYKTQ